jgi:hypothetical protein
MEWEKLMLSKYTMKELNQMAKEIVDKLGWIKGTREIAVWGIEDTWDKLWLEETEKVVKDKPCTK